MNRSIETGVFIPTGRNGWIHSVNAPDTPGTFDHVLQVVQAAEAGGFDFVLSPGIWRGRKGPARHWMDSVESITTTAALLQATSRIGVYGTVHVTVFPPATIAKMMSTLDQIGPGRTGLNLVTGSSYLDLAHVGLWNSELDHDERYDLAEEWVAVAKRLWTEDAVTHHGKFFETADATMGPKPSRLPPLLNAGASQRGFRFAAENCDVALVTGSDSLASLETVARCRKMAEDMGNPSLKIFAAPVLVPGKSDQDARSRVEHFDAGVDVECLADIAAGYERNPNTTQVSKESTTFTSGETSAISPGSLVGSPETLARRLATMVNEGGIDGFMFIVPDYLTDLDVIAAEVLPRLAEHGITCRDGATVGR
ncbi:MAG: LLM class flavin-dependent oxidoreductase [Pseudonocardia sp.]|nr:LLM class flavin-dependent oxidoreductase [Pseudonocardia sp.]